ncbi:MAG: hypothetical protein ACE5H1_02075 [Thermodesulfobacteriota bacterium]
MIIQMDSILRRIVYLSSIFLFTSLACLSVSYDVTAEETKPFILNGKNNLKDKDSYKSLIRGSKYKYDDFDHIRISQIEEGIKPLNDDKEQIEGDQFNTLKDKQDPKVTISDPVQFCQGKFKKIKGSGIEIITLKCPRVDDKCSCEKDKKNDSEWLDCGGLRKFSSNGSDLLSCESIIVGSGNVAE